MYSKFPGDDVIGYTYDVFGYYADQRSAKRKVVDYSGAGTPVAIQGKLYEVPAGLTASEYNRSEIFMASGEGYKEFSASLDARVSLRARRKVGFFAMTKNSFGVTVRGDSKSMYSGLYDLTYAGQVRIPDPAKVPLDRDFAARLDDPECSAKELFKTYGTHLVTGVLVGGCVRYFAYGKKSNSYGKAQFESDVRARYRLISGSTHVDSTASGSKSSVHDAADLVIIGGTQEARDQLSRNQDFATWTQSVAENPQFVDFLNDGLLPIWALCKDPTRRQQLEDELELLYTPIRRASEWYNFKGSKFEVDLLNADSEHEIMTGFGGHIRKDDFVGAAIQLENAQTGERRWKYWNDARDFEVSWTVPPGCAMTGIALRASSDDLKNLRVYYQCLDLGTGAGSGTCLDAKVLSHDEPGPHDGWEVDTRTSAGNRKVMAGVRLRAHDGDVTDLSGYMGNLVLPLYE